MLSSTSDKAKLFAENFLKTLILIILVSLYLFSVLKLHNMFITPKMVKKAITNLDSSKASGLDCIPVVVLKNCESEVFHISLKEFYRLFEGQTGNPCI